MNENMNLRDTIAGLVRRHLLRSGEALASEKEWPDGLAFTTNHGRTFLATEADDVWQVVHESWVRGMLSVTEISHSARSSLEEGFLYTQDRKWLYLGDSAEVARLGKYLAIGQLAPYAYAQILTAWHPRSPYAHGLVQGPDHLKIRFSNPTLPEFPGPALDKTRDTATLTFYAYYHHQDTSVTVERFVVTVPTDASATWTHEHVLVEPCPRHS